MDTEDFNDESDFDEDAEESELMDEDNNEDDNDEDEDEEQEEEDDEEECTDNDNQSEYQIKDDQNILDIELDENDEPDKSRSTGKGDIKQSVITKSTKQAFVNYLQNISKPLVTNASASDSILSVVHSMFLSRGFTLLTNPVKVEYKHLKSLLLRKKNVIVGVRNKETMCVFFTKDAKLGIQNAREIEETITNFQINQVVVITTDGVTPVAMKLLLHVKCLIHFFQTHELMKKYTDHALIPIQRQLTESETKDFLLINMAKLDKLPKMSRLDPIAKFNGWGPGSIISSIRLLGDSAEPYEYWRVIS
jgi:DNA-directed RNA polymerase subunit H (RpoH/RPB5)